MFGRLKTMVVFILNSCKNLQKIIFYLLRPIFSHSDFSCEKKQFKIVNVIMLRRIQVSMWSNNIINNNNKNIVTIILVAMFVCLSCGFILFSPTLLTRCV